MYINLSAIVFSLIPDWQKPKLKWLGINFESWNKFFPGEGVVPTTLGGKDDTTTGGGAGVVSATAAAIDK